MIDYLDYAQKYIDSAEYYADDCNRWDVAKVYCQLAIATALVHIAQKLGAIVGDVNGNKAVKVRQEK
jgi:hypothetical protein